MLAIGTKAHGERRRRAASSGGMTGYKSEWMESGTDSRRSPTIFLVEQPPHGVLRTHFHRQNQFQVFVDGSGAIGPSEIRPFTVHYAGAYTGYGPLVAGPSGLKYFTIRPVFDEGALYVDSDRGAMLRGPKRHATSPAMPASNAVDRRTLAAPVCEEVIPVGDDGMGARLLRLPPGALARTAFPAAADGTFAMVLDGAVEYDGGVLQRFESLFVSTEAEWPVARAGADGADVLFMFVPVRSPAYPA